MSDTNSSPWQNIEGTHPDVGFNDWFVMENRWGEFGEPGFTQTIHPMTAPHMTGVEGQVSAKWTFYRGDDGSLLGVHACHIVNGEQKPIFLMVHPDHQRQGIGTMIADYVITQYETERGKKFPYNEIWGTLPADFYTAPSANFVNKYANNANGQ
jgi:GNAT superfamily N-acetyltransferase